MYVVQCYWDNEMLYISIMSSIPVHFAYSMLCKLNTYTYGISEYMRVTLLRNTPGIIK